MSILTRLALRILRPYLFVLVAVGDDGKHTVEIHARWPKERRAELLASGFKGRNVSIASRCIIHSPDPNRRYGPAWKQAVGWTP